jgi:OOP family OmpA-OmpF porin
MGVVTAMIQPRKWWVGLPVVAILFALAATLNSETLENDLADRARAALAQPPRTLHDAQVTASGRDVTIAGVVLSREAAAKAVDKVEQLPGVRAVVDATTAPPVAKPFVFVLQRRDKNIALSGNAPFAGERERIRAAAQSRGFETTDTASYAAGAPKNFEALATYALAVLAELDDGRVTLSDDALSVSGAARTFDTYDRTLSALRSPPLGAHFAAVEVKPPRAAPFVWKAAKSGEAVVLSGFVPSNEIRDFLHAKAAALGAVEIKDETRIASGEPSGGFADAAAVALAELANLTEGKAALTDAQLSIEGSGKPNVTKAGVEAHARGGLPKGFALGPVDVAAGIVSPYAFKAQRDGSTLTLSGYAPDENARATIAESAAHAFDGKIVNGLAIADGAPRGYVSAVTASLQALARLADGAVSVSDREITLEGAAFHSKAPADIERRLASQLPDGFKSAARLAVIDAQQPAEPGRLRLDLAAIAERGLSFDAGDRLDPRSFPVLDAFASTLLRSPDVAIDVIGRTDEAGHEAEAIMRRRAQAVVDYLLQAGVEPTRLTATGFAASEADNGGGAQNRRIEFAIK